jgi:hypothetical protein
MKFTIKLMLGVVLVMVVALPFTFAQEEETTEFDAEAAKETFYVEFNRVLREEIETRALAHSAILDEVAQTIADEIGCTEDRVDFDIKFAVADLGYEMYPGDNEVRTTRIPLLPIVNERPIEEMATFYTGDIFESNINQAGRFYREIGIGVAPCIVDLGPDSVGSTQQYTLFVILGSQPNVIPLVIENGASQITAETTPVPVTLSIHQENSRQRPGIFGRAETMRLSSTPLDDSVEAVRYEDTVAWELADCGENSVFYELTDAEGLTVEGSATVEVVCE